MRCASKTRCGANSRTALKSGEPKKVIAGHVQQSHRSPGLGEEPDRDAGRARATSCAAVRATMARANQRSHRYGFNKLLRHVENDSSDQGRDGAHRFARRRGDAPATRSGAQMNLLSKKKPMVISMSDAAASGGYYMAMTGDPIVAYPATVTGLDRRGLRQAESARALRQARDHEGRDSARHVTRISTPITPAHARRARRSCARASTKVIAISSPKWRTARHRKFEEIEPLAQGRVWLGSQAKARGLVDEIGGLDTARRDGQAEGEDPGGRARGHAVVSGQAEPARYADEESRRRTWWR